jgi:hypothetical protein
MIVHNLHVFRSVICPAKTDPELIVYTNAVLALARSLKSLQMIPRRRA